MKKSNLVMPLVALVFAMIASVATAALPRTLAQNGTYSGDGDCNDLEAECDSATGVNCSNSGTVVYKINLNCATQQTGNFVQ